MMVSNGYSKRRGPLRRPKVCKSSPNPGRCHPDPPPPPWPPSPFTFDFEYTYLLIMFPVTENWTLELNLTPGSSTFWWGSGVAPIRDVQWNLNIPGQSADIYVTGFDPAFGSYAVQRYVLPLVWNVPTPYSVTTWDTMSSPLIAAKADFTF